MKELQTIDPLSIIGAARDRVCSFLPGREWQYLEVAARSLEATRLEELKHCMAKHVLSPFRICNIVAAIAQRSDLCGQSGAVDKFGAGEHSCLTVLRHGIDVDGVLRTMAYMMMMLLAWPLKISMAATTSANDKVGLPVV